MHITARLPTLHGLRLLLPQPAVCIRVTQAELQAPICAFERGDAEAEWDGRFVAADRLAHQAIMLLGTPQ